LVCEFKRYRLDLYGREFMKLSQKLSQRLLEAKRGARHAENQCLQEQDSERGNLICLSQTASMHPRMIGGTLSFDRVKAGHVLA
jgi:hypothetical protein